VVSLIASSTETVCALGCGDRLAGRSHECDYPDFVKALPVCSSTAVDPAKPSLDIDRQVRSVLEQALSVYRVEVAQLEALQPDLILTQDHCEVCAVSLKDVEAACCELLASRPRIVSLAPEDWPAVLDGIAVIAEALGEKNAGEELLGRMHDRLEAVRQSASGAPMAKGVFVEWVEPMMVGANWMPELAKIANCELRLSVKGRHSPRVTLNDIGKADPDFILVAPCGFDLERTRIEAKALRLVPGWKNLRAVKENRVFVADGNAYFNRPGPRLVESAEILAEAIHDSDFGHRGKGWERL
jgi:iron complex transport system substrate-binding protein